MVARLRERFQIRHVIVVPTAVMIAQDTLRLLAEHETAPFDCILGCRLRRDKEVGRHVLARPGRYQRVVDDLEVKEVVVEGRRYVVCRNPDEAKPPRRGPRSSPSSKRRWRMGRRP
jgi:hypothetical protein